MREIQDLTLHRERSSSVIDAAFKAHHGRFLDQLDAFFAGKEHGSCAVGMRTTLIPVGAPLYVDRVYDNASAAPLERILRARSALNR
jgi:hypothetical protein